MIKVLILGLHGILGGSETYVNNLIRGFNKKEIICDFLVVGSDRTPYEESINDFYADGYNHFYYCPNLKQSYYKGKQWLKKFYDNNHYNLIYLNATSAANVIYCDYAIKNKKIPLITHSHFSNGPWVNHILYRAYTRKKSNYKLACSELAAKWMFGKKISDVILIPNGIDVERFEFNIESRRLLRDKFNIKDEQILLGHVGRFSVEKNHSFIIDLCKKLPEKFVFLCVGDGPCKEKILQLVKENELENRIIILPVDMEIEKYYSAMDLFILPSLYEGLPIVSVEAQASGLQVVFSDTISKQADLTGKCYFEEINNVEAWIKRINNMKFNRFEGKSYILKSGFSISDTTKKVEVLMRELCKEQQID